MYRGSVERGQDYPNTQGRASNEAPAHMYRGRTKPTFGEYRGCSRFNEAPAHMYRGRPRSI